jgi:SAM-dependent methyltransferase
MLTRARQKVLHFLISALLRVSRWLGKDRTWHIFHEITLCDDSLLIQCLRRQCDRQGSPFYAFHVFSEMSHCARQHDHVPAAVLEIGTGSALGSLFCFVASGVERAVGVDVEPISGDKATFYEDLRDYLACVGGFEWWRYYAAADERPYVKYPNCWDHVRAKELLDRIEYYSPVYSHDLPFDANSFDFVYTVAVLEHLDQPDSSLAEIHRVLEPNGLTIHEIDLRDHGSGDPVRFLALSDEEYLPKTHKYGHGRGEHQILDGSWEGEAYCNRLRLSDWQKLFVNNGFEILTIEPLCTIGKDELKRREFSEPFSSKTLGDLSVVLVRIVARCAK